LAKIRKRLETEQATKQLAQRSRRLRVPRCL